jgi:predicted dehydrogenase
VRVGVIGFGVGEQHARAYMADERCDLVAICDIDSAKREAARKIFPDAEIMEDPFALLSRPDIDVVSIASPDDAHYSQIIAAIDTGKHIFVEKPVCLRWTELVDIRRRLKNRPQLVFSSNPILRMSPRFQDIRARVQNGEIGQSYFMEADYCYGRIHKIIDGWRGRISNYSVVLGGGVHVVDLLLWMAGKRVTDVAAFGNNICTRDTQFGFDDLTAAILRFEDGQVAKVSANFGCVMPHFHRLIIYGTNGTVENDFDAARLWKSRDPQVAPQLLDTPYPGVQKGGLIRNFVDAVIDGARLLVSQEDLFHTMAVCFAIDSAKADGKVTAVNSIGSHREDVD